MGDQWWTWEPGMQALPETTGQWRYLGAIPVGNHAWACLDGGWGTGDPGTTTAPDPSDPLTAHALRAQLARRVHLDPSQGVIWAPTGGSAPLPSGGRVYTWRVTTEGGSHWFRFPTEDPTAALIAALVETADGCPPDMVGGEEG